MTNRNLRPRWIAAVLVVVELLALIAWWRWSATSHAMTTPTSRTAIAAVSRSSNAEPAAIATGTSTAATVAADTEKASALQVCDRDFKRSLREYREQLGPARSADEDIDRLLLEFLALDPSDWMSAEVGSEYQAASKRWPDDLDLAWLSFDMCNDECDRNAEIQHLLSIDSDNAAAWMAAMDAARQQKDQRGFDFALRKAALAKTYDPRIGGIFAHLRPQLAAVASPDSCRTTIWNTEMEKDLGRAPTENDRLDSIAGSAEMAIALPSFSGIFGCKDDDIQITEMRRTQCIALLSRVAAGDTLVEQILADTLLIGLQQDPEQLARLRERYRQLRWLMATAREKPFPEHYFARMYADGEVATMQAIAIERGQ